MLDHPMHGRRPSLQDGKMLPGQKGISMNGDQWAKLKAAMSALTDQLQS
jgi:hypothetical protein